MAGPRTHSAPARAAALARDRAALRLLDALAAYGPLPQVDALDILALPRTRAYKVLAFLRSEGALVRTDQGRWALPGAQ